MSVAPDSVPVPPHDAAEERQRIGQVILVWAVGAFCIYGWDWIICLPQEYQRIWKKKLTPISVIFLVVRYFVFVLFSLVVSLMTATWRLSHAECKSMVYLYPVGALILTFLAQIILGVRVYAIYGQSRTVAIILSLILIGQVSIGGISASLTSAPVADPSDASLPCIVLPSPLRWMVAYCSVSLLYDTVVFLLTAWKTYKFWRMEVNTPLVAIIWRDGVLYFFSIFSMNLINVLIFSISPNPLMWIVNIAPTELFTVLLSCRIVLNVRETLEGSSPLAAKDSNSTENQTCLSTNNEGLSPDASHTTKSEDIEISVKVDSQMV